MARRRRKAGYEDHENHERWLVSYADFITLLFAFFVVMYSISSINEGKYRVLSSTLTDAFLTEATTMEPIQVGELVRTIKPVSGEFAAPDILPEESPLPEVTDTSPRQAQEESPEAVEDQALPLQVVKQELAKALENYISKDLVEITQTNRGVEVEMGSKMLFESGSARLSSEAVGVLRNVADILRPIKNTIQVEGHTDNVPIKTLAFPSNWELSAARAASVVHLLARLKVNPRRMAAVGYGEHRPIRGNHLAEGRAKNRRVALIIMSQTAETLKWDPPSKASEGQQ